ncbi:MAG: hypothetical protein KGH93_02455 [Patescibacteria group bacterium]|nr:hypothetical protein [Patescibacteria group bacterium]
MIYIVTLPERAAEKKKYFSAVAESIAKGALEKITIKSFEAKSSHAGILT